MLIDRIDQKRLRRSAAKAVRDGAIDGDLDVVGDFLLARTNAIEVTNLWTLVPDRVFTGSWSEAKDGPIRDDSYTFQADRFPNVAPPFRSYWIEWKHDPMVSNNERVGAWCVITDDGDGDPRWTVTCSVWVGDRDATLVGRFVFRVDRDGTGLEISDLDAFELTRLSKSHPKASDALSALTDEQQARMDAAQAVSVDEHKRVVAECVAELNVERDRLVALVNIHARHMLRLRVFPMLFTAHAIMACKNSGFETHRVSPVLSKAHQRRHGHPKVVFKTLTIHPRGGAARGVSAGTGGRVAVGDGVMALSLVRGHFKTYTADAPLLGKHTGTWYWQPMARGNSKVGVVVKDYKLAAP